MNLEELKKDFIEVYRLVKDLYVTEGTANFTSLTKE